MRLLSFVFCLLLVSTSVASDPAEIAAQMNAAFAEGKATGKPVKTTYGRYDTKPFGPAIIGEPDWGVTNWYGEGRGSAFVLDDDETEHGIVNLRNQGDWHDAQMKDLGFYGNNKGPTLLNISAYSFHMENIYCRGTLYGKGKNNGLHLNGGQHYRLTNVQCELLEGTGIHLHNVLFADLESCNGEACDIGLLLTADPIRPRAGMISINHFYAEASPIGIKSDGVRFKLTGGVYCGSRNHTAVQLNDCNGCYLDVSQSMGKVVLDAACHNNEVVVGFSDTVRVIDNGDGNKIRTVVTPAFGEPSSNPRSITTNNGQYHRINEIVSLDAGESVTVKYVYDVDSHCRLIAQAYDLIEKKHYNYKTNDWDSKGTSVYLPYIVGQTCSQEITIEAGDAERLMQVRFIMVNGYGTTARLHRIEK